MFLLFLLVEGVEHRVTRSSINRKCFTTGSISRHRWSLSEVLAIMSDRLCPGTRRRSVHPHLSLNFNVTTFKLPIPPHTYHVDNAS